MTVEQLEKGKEIWISISKIEAQIEFWEKTKRLTGISGRTQVGRETQIDTSFVNFNLLKSVSLSDLHELLGREHEKLRLI